MKWLLNYIPVEVILGVLPKLIIEAARKSGAKDEKISEYIRLTEIVLGELKKELPQAKEVSEG